MINLCLAKLGTGKYWTDSRPHSCSLWFYSRTDLPAQHAVGALRCCHSWSCYGGLLILLCSVSVGVQVSFPFSHQCIAHARTALQNKHTITPRERWGTRRGTGCRRPGGEVMVSSDKGHNTSATLECKENIGGIYVWSLTCYYIVYVWCLTCYCIVSVWCLTCMLLMCDMFFMRHKNCVLLPSACYSVFRFLPF